MLPGKDEGPRPLCKYDPRAGQIFPTRGEPGREGPCLLRRRVCYRPPATAAGEVFLYFCALSPTGEQTMTTRLTPAQQSAFDALAAAWPVGNVFLFSAADGMGRTT